MNTQKIAYIANQEIPLTKITIDGSTAMSNPAFANASKAADTTNGLTVDPITPAVEPNKIVETATKASNPAANKVTVTIEYNAIVSSAIP